MSRKTPGYFKLSAKSYLSVASSFCAKLSGKPHGELSSQEVRRGVETGQFLSDNPQVREQQLQDGRKRSEALQNARCPEGDNRTPFRFTPPPTDPKTFTPAFNSVGTRPSGTEGNSITGSKRSRKKTSTGDNKPRRQKKCKR